MVPAILARYRTLLGEQPGAHGLELTCRWSRDETTGTQPMSSCEAKDLMAMATDLLVGTP
jgi:hypothetical protein